MSCCIVRERHQQWGPGCEALAQGSGTATGPSQRNIQQPQSPDSAGLRHPPSKLNYTRYSSKCHMPGYGHQAGDPVPASRGP
eukprot:5097125-Prymnesium_polylepis.2